MAGAPKYLAVYRRLKQMVDVCADGEKLPPVKELCETYQVCLATLLSALDLLGKDGMIRREPKRGIYCTKGGASARKLRITLLLPGEQEPLFVAVITTCHRFCKARGVELKVESFELDPRSELAELEAVLHDDECCGLLYMPLYPLFDTPEALEMLRRIHRVKPVVQFDRQLGDGETSFIGYDCYHDCRAAVEYLIECGHRSIGLIRASNDSEAAPSSRLAGYFDALKANGLAYDPRYTIVYDVFKPDLANDVVEILSSSGCPSAYFAVNSVYVPRFMRKVLFVNKSVPRDFSLICYDLPDTLTNFSQEITYVSEPTREVVAAAAEQLLREIARRPEAPRQQLLRGHFVYGESCRELRAV